MFWLSDVTSDTQYARSMHRYEKRARAARAAALHTALAAAGGIGAAATRAAVAGLNARRRRREAIAELNDLGERLLADIGLTRADVALIRRGQWPARIGPGPGERTAPATGSATRARTAPHGDHRDEVEWRRAA